MEYREIIEYLGFAAGHDLQVRITTRDGTELVGTPSSLDTHLTAQEVYLRPFGVDDTEIGLSLSHVLSVELL